MRHPDAKRPTPPLLHLLLAEFIALLLGEDQPTHVHHCEKCGYRWVHADTCAGDQNAHTCVCGNVVWRRVGES